MKSDAELSEICPRCQSPDVVQIGQYNPGESDAWKCLECEKEWEE